MRNLIHGHHHSMLDIAQKVDTESWMMMKDMVQMITQLGTQKRTETQDIVGVDMVISNM